MLNNLCDIVWRSSYALHLEDSVLILNAPNLIHHRLELWVLIKDHLADTGNACQPSCTRLKLQHPGLSTSRYTCSWQRQLEMGAIDGELKQQC